MVELRNINVSFNNRKKEFKAIDNVSLSIKSGEIYGIVGSSGAGKSTLLRTINHLQSIDSGEIIIGGKNVERYSGKELRNLRKNIGMIFQHFNLAESKTVYKNIEFVLKESGKSSKESEARIKQLLKFVGLEEKINEYPSNLSGGQKQRVAIARALANNANILLCDEPTSALDVETTNSVLKLLKDINKKLGVTIIIITHELEVVKEICDRVAVMKDGRIIEEGNVYDVFTNPKEEFTKHLIGHTQQFEIPIEIIDISKGPILKLTYLNENAEEALISNVSTKYNIEFNILHGKIEYISGRPIGILYINVLGNKEVVEEAIEYLREKTERLEVIRDV
ncbi:methionine ABC transporter ATP-binding protein [Clostridium sp. MSJ-8]|uniref:methionine ABC transporter ATP-binding protein n=1 Tax=Clostridium sp. MSJ-8 TaxID=2841510 RepID=UPI001C0EB147|nr:methionine ABC transporter ATP-binding protein [Clostridium sp. MSJ-8]MBU5486928.1 methionine ABC transporter ATP-binding protein [Clostridium sp. MSJ-8]